MNDILDESNIMETIINRLDKLLDTLIRLLKEARKKLIEFRLNYKSNDINKNISNINISNIKSKNIEYFKPNKDSIKLYLDVIYKDSYDYIPNRVLNMIYNNTDMDTIYFDVFNSKSSDTYSDNNDYIYLIRKYLSSAFKSECNNKNDLLKNLSNSFTNNKHIQYMNSIQICEELLSKKDINKTSIGKELKEISDTKSWILDYYNKVSNDSLIKTNKLKNEIKNNKNRYSKEEYDVLYQVIYHYIRMIKDADVYKAIKLINDMEYQIYNNINTIIRGNSVND